MRLHILGQAAGCPGPGGGCAGYLVEAGRSRVMLDCGPGTLGRLQAVRDLDELDAVVLSHAHADHFLDLIPLAYGLMMRCQTRDPDRRLKRVPVFLPEGGRATVAAVSAALGHAGWRFPPSDVAGPAHAAFRALLDDAPDFVQALLPMTEYRPGDAWDVAGLRVTSRPARHGPPAASLRVEAGGRTLAYSGDTTLTDELVETARGADVFLCEATVTPDDLGTYTAHLSPAEAGRVAAEAGAGALVLTHVWPWADAELEAWMRAEAGRAFTGPVAIARPGDTIPVGGPEPTDGGRR